MRLALTMIARDEERHIGACLESVEGLVDQVVLVDTGSTDRTPAIAKERGALVLSRPWQGDFAWARNEALAAARAPWALVMDADERFEGDPSEVHRLLRRKGVIAFEVPILSPLVGAEHIHSAVRLFRRAPGVRFERRLHEQVLPSLLRRFPGGSVLTAPFRLLHLGYREDEVERKGKHQRNVTLAEAEVADHPEDAFARLNVGVEYLALGRRDDAAAAFAAAHEHLTHIEAWQSRLYKIEAENLLALSRTEEAKARLEEGIRTFPLFTDLYFLLGILLFDAGRTGEAADLFRRCLEMGPAPSPPHDGVDPSLGTSAPLYMLGRVALVDGRAGEAFPLLLESVTLRPDWLPAIQTLLECALIAGRDIGAIVTASPPPDPLPLGAVLLRLHDPLHALQAFERAEALRPALPGQHYLMKAACLLRLGETERAEAELGRSGLPRAEGSPACFIADAIRLCRGELSPDEARRRYEPTHAFWDLLAEGGEFHPALGK